MSNVKNVLKMIREKKDKLLEREVGYELFLEIIKPMLSLMSTEERKEIESETGELSEDIKKQKFKINFLENMLTKISEQEENLKNSENKH